MYIFIVHDKCNAVNEEGREVSINSAINMAMAHLKVPSILHLLWSICCTRILYASNFTLTKVADSKMENGVDSFCGGNRKGVGALDSTD